MDLDIVITPEQRRSFHEQGFLVIERIVSDAYLAWLRPIYDRIFSERLGWADGSHRDLVGDERDGRLRLPQVMSPNRLVSGLDGDEYHRAVRRIAAQLHDPEFARGEIGEHMICKPPGDAPETPWHQDPAYWNPRELYESLNCWLPLDDATVANGCLAFVPGSQRFDVLPHHPLNGDPGILGLEVDEPARWAALGVAAPVPAGGCALHQAFTLHYGHPNRSPRPRRAYILGIKRWLRTRETPVDNHWSRSQRTGAQQRQAAASATPPRPCAR